MTDKTGNTALHLAAREGYLITTFYLLTKKNANTNAVDKNAYTPLASRQGEFHIAIVLLW